MEVLGLSTEGESAGYASQARAGVASDTVAPWIFHGQTHLVAWTSTRYSAGGGESLANRSSSRGSVPGRAHRVEKSEVTERRTDGWATGQLQASARTARGSQFFCESRSLCCIELFCCTLSECMAMAGARFTSMTSDREGREGSGSEAAAGSRERQAGSRESRQQLGSSKECRAGQWARSNRSSRAPTRSNNSASSRLPTPTSPLRRTRGTLI